MQTIQEAQEKLAEIEQHTSTKFVKRSSTSEYISYICRNDKAYHKREAELFNLEREPKSNKIKCDFSCPTYLSISKNKDGFTVKCAIFHPHDISEFQTTLSEPVKNEIHQKLLTGLGETAILKKIREEFPSFIISLQDIYNIKNSRCYSPIILDNSDKLSCLKHSKNNPDITIVEYDEPSIIIMVQTSFQKDILSQYQSSINIFGLDSTHCTNSYGFYLTSLHLILPNHQGIPVGHMISSDEQELSITKFLEHMKQFISPQKHNLITDDYPAYLNAWKATIGDCDHVQCLWHLKKNWKINLTKNQITGIKSVRRKLMTKCLDSKAVSCNMFKKAIKKFLKSI